MKQLTEQEIREAVNTPELCRNNPDYWLALKSMTDNEELKEKILQRFSSAYHYEEYEAGLL